MAPSRRRPSGLTQGFTLIELLVVIAIIAILTAILLPVFASVREGSRQGVAISNMKDIQQKMEQFKLDNHKYPDVLFGYAFPGSTMQSGLSMAQNAGKAAIYFPGLYPAYIKDPNVFTDPNNPTDPNSTPQITPALSDAYVISPCSVANDEVLSSATTTPSGASNCTGAASGAAVPTVRYFYIMDAYDSSPAVTGGNSISTTVYITRYQTAREPLQTPVPSDTRDPYYHQLRWQNPPADTLVTMTPYHVKNADKVLVMFQSGAVKKVKAEDFLNPNPDTKDNFWKIKP